MLESAASTEQVDRVRHAQRGLLNWTLKSRTAQEQHLCIFRGCRARATFAGMCWEHAELADLEDLRLVGRANGRRCLLHRSGGKRCTHKVQDRSLGLCRTCKKEWDERGKDVARRMNLGLAIRPVSEDVATTVASVIWTNNQEDRESGAPAPAGSQAPSGVRAGQTQGARGCTAEGSSSPRLPESPPATSGAERGGCGDVASLPTPLASSEDVGDEETLEVPAERLSTSSAKGERAHAPEAEEGPQRNADAALGGDLAARSAAARVQDPEAVARAESRPSSTSNDAAAEGEPSVTAIHVDPLAPSAVRVVPPCSEAAPPVSSPNAPSQGEAAASELPPKEASMACKDISSAEWKPEVCEHPESQTAMRVCRLVGCTDPVHGRGLCRAAYMRLRRLGPKYLDKFGTPSSRKQGGRGGHRAIRSYPACVMTLSEDWTPELDANPEAKFKARKCRMKDCQDPAKNRGLCAVATQRLRSRGLFDQFALPAKATGTAGKCNLDQAEPKAEDLARQETLISELKAEVKSLQRAETSLRRQLARANQNYANSISTVLTELEQANRKLRRLEAASPKSVQPAPQAPVPPAVVQGATEHAAQGRGQPSGAGARLDLHLHLDGLGAGEVHLHLHGAPQGVPASSPMSPPRGGEATPRPRVHAVGSWAPTSPTEMRRARTSACGLPAEGLLFAWNRVVDGEDLVTCPDCRSAGREQ